MNRKEIVLEVANKIQDTFHPQKILLFGSYAWGKPDDNSDIDLFIIMKSDLRRDIRARNIQRIFPSRTFPLDIIVYTPEEIEKSLDRGNLFVKEILDKGSMLYG